MRYLLSGLLACCLLSSCTTKELELPAPGTPAIIVAAPVVCTTQYDEKVTLPAGTYRAEARSPKGIYYAAPTPLKTSGLVRKGSEHGGLFIANEGWQWVWTGHPGYEISQSGTTILGKRGIIMPTHAKFDPYVPYKTAKR